MLNAKSGQTIFQWRWGVLKTETLKIKRSDIEELNQLVRDYSERTEDDVVHIKLEKANLDKHEAEKLIELLEERTIYLPLRRGVFVEKNVWRTTANLS